MKIVVTGGGTGGHIYPALAIARYFSEVEQAEILYIGTERGLESDIVPRSGFAFRTIEVSGLKRSLSSDTLKTFARLGKGLLQARRILKEYQPDVVIGCGGYVVAPVVFMAKMLAIPTYIHEMDVFPGLTNRSLSRFADRIGVSFEGSVNYFSNVKHKVVVAGNPRASEVVKVTPDETRQVKQELGLDPEKKTVVIVSGSRGAKPINDAVLSMLESVSNQRRFQLLYITGQIHYEDVAGQLKRTGFGPQSGIFVQPFVYNMPPLLAGSDLLVSRAGATTIAEATALGVPGIYIPSPYVTNNHQEYNARWLADAGAGVMIRESELTPGLLFQAIQRLMESPSDLRKMKERSKALGLPEAMSNIHRTIMELVK
ncbi:undecaprenyldiphospho-muramoylpentapeptide beta-N-acetylglucosaminyltransferase [Effusibacillus lacus]|uniref:UDP-N-acetylglucosamine--N-acetylmuramyl-(pentapeptide) pyrophosphoryl-undecaprenol N-acetylglucosamine transferase n=1 Tax=Effusibacillus lacus TaxID=1348429 RepID=A0A292YP99_9BACL|nr:undecaprenyldiphospho-muramoylpentapeptide beta-N-acetylglucosaminyltransferase [Effusibacillus lacus]GAX91006.1 undecaprenyldiphospho-muramoylpentapeptide beta-N- acetylglucosaminyltransferase [Effusibacillus lacus]